MPDPPTAARAGAPERFPQPPAGHRDWYAFEAIRALPRLLLLVDKNPFSPTYGCFDREYWHYRTRDFPCAMSQEFCLPLALAHVHAFPHNPWRGSARLRELAVAAIEFARRHTHGDGACDDYFPFEKALGAHVFSTYAMTESHRVLGLERPDLLDFYRLRGDWLRRHNESGRLSNHQALAALALYNVHLLTGDAVYREASQAFRDLALSWQHEEGWFQEYEGADPGYQSCTISFLAKLWQKSGDPVLIEPLQRAVAFAALFMHPDGSYGGEYGSRNTYHFYPHGFELLSAHSELAARVADTYLLRSLPERRRYFNDDDRMCGHYVHDWMQAWLDHEERAPLPLEALREPFERWLPGARLFVKKTGRYYAVVSLAKGGVLKVFDANGPLYADTGLIAETDDGEVLVSQLVDDYDLEVDLAAGRLAAAGRLSRRRTRLSSPLKQIAFRLVNLSLGRLAADRVRQALQRLLITGKPRSAARFRRELRFDEQGIEIRDRIDLSGTRLRLRRLMCGSDATSIYVANSTNFQEAMLLPWTDLGAVLPRLAEAGVLDLPPRRVPTEPGAPLRRAPGVHDPRADDLRSGASR